MSISNSIAASSCEAFCHSEPTQNLEEQLADQVVTEVDIYADYGFKDYLSPNERAPRNIKRHLDLMEEGLIVSTGTERSFFDMLLSPKSKCTGLVIRDINPRVKAYTDFLILLLRISSDRLDFCELAEGPFTDEKRAAILERINPSNIPDAKMRKYYEDNLDSFAKIYYPVSHKISPDVVDPEPTDVDYWSDDELFNQLKSYAASGKIVSTLGDIGDLEFLKGQKVSIVDTSNIQDYQILDLRVDSRPRVIWNAQFRDFVGESYNSYKHKPLDQEQKNRIDLLIGRVHVTVRTPARSLPFTARVVSNAVIKTTFQDAYKLIGRCRVNPFKYPAPLSYSQSTLKALELLEDRYEGIPIRTEVREQFLDEENY